MPERGTALGFDVEGWLNSADLSLVIRHVGNWYSLSAADRQDLAQEVRIAVWRAAGAAISLAWIYGVARNKAVDLTRANVRAARHAALRLPSQPEHGDAELASLMRARAAHLPLELREFYRLRFVEGRTHREVAQKLGLRRGTVRGLEAYCRRFFSGRRA